MCDYSLMALPNRLAVCGDELVVHRFELGSLGLASAVEVLSRANREKTNSDLSFLQRLNEGVEYLTHSPAFCDHP